MRRRSRTAEVVDLDAVRSHRRQRLYRARLRRVLDGNEQAVARLFHSGLLFTRQGTRAGRDLLLARQHLVRVGDLIHRLAPGEELEGSEELFRELDELLEKSDRLASRTDEFVASLV
ncbi:hypothetical protein [Vulgatibacter sp.]|uniref:hypothetical protein n=1 Tax=Vulgatibacter sp. TaxID=1971226 RepID=UPI003568C736